MKFTQKLSGLLFIGPLCMFNFTGFIHYKIMLKMEFTFYSKADLYGSNFQILPTLCQALRV